MAVEPTMWTDGGDEIPAVWNLDRYLCDHAAQTCQTWADTHPDHASHAKAVDIALRMRAHVHADWIMAQPEIAERMRQAWADLTPLIGDIDPDMPGRIAGLLDEYIAEDADPDDFLDRVRALAAAFRTTPVARETWVELANILPSLWT